MILFSTAVFFVLWGLWRKKDVYELFVEGAKEGFKIAVTIIPYLVAMLTAIAVFHASGMFDLLLAGMEKILSGLGWDAGASDRADEAAFRQRRPGHDDRNHADLRRRQFSRFCRLNRPGFDGNHLLCAGGLFRCGKDNENPFGAALRAAGRSGRNCYRHCRRLLLL